MGKESEQSIFQIRYTNDHQVYEKMLKLLIIRKVQIKTTVRYYRTLVRMPIIK